MFARRSLSCNRALEKSEIWKSLSKIYLDSRFYFKFKRKAKGGWASQHLDDLGSLLPRISRWSLALGHDYGAMHRRGCSSLQLKVMLTIVDNQLCI